MSQSGESFTLLESGTTRLHFKLAKALEDADSTHQQDLVILETVAQIRTELASRSASKDASQLVSALLTLLHCLHHYPASKNTLTLPSSPIDVSFALIPALQLLSLATDWKHLLLAHQLLPFLLHSAVLAPPPAKLSHSRADSIKSDDEVEELTETESQISACASTSSRPSSSIERARSSRHPSASVSSRAAHKRATPLPSQKVDDSSSLLLLNTFRSDLTAAATQAQQDPHHSTPEPSTRSRSRSGLSSPSSSRSSSLTKSARTPIRDGSSTLSSFRAMASLRSLASGVPQGTAVLPSLASTLVALTRHPDSAIRSMTLNAVLACSTFAGRDQADNQAQTEMLEAALTIVRLILGSTYAFSPGSDLDEHQGMILSEMERRVDSNPAVLRSCIKIVDHARSAGHISGQEAACHAIEALQASRWAPMHLDLPALQQSRISTQVAVRTEGLRARTAARQRASLQVEHDYHGSYAPWLVDACLASLAKSVQSIIQSSSTELDQITHKDLLKTVLRTYNVASQGKAAALALCVSAARCIGALSLSTRPDLHGDSDKETEALWSSLSAHVKSQLRSTNPNRKTAGLIVLEALLPVGWAQSKTETSSDQPREQAPSASPLQMSEADMGQIMALLADKDSSIRKRALALLHQVDSGLTALLREQLQSVVDSDLLARKGSSHVGDLPQPSAHLSNIAQRLLEVALFAMSSLSDQGHQNFGQADEAISALVNAFQGGVKLRLFGSFESTVSQLDQASAAATLLDLASLPIGIRLDLLRRLSRANQKLGSTGDFDGLHLICYLICDMSAEDLREAADEFFALIGAELFGADGLLGVLVRLSQDQPDAVAGREAVLGTLARSISLAVQLVGPTQASADLANDLQELQSTLSKLIETEPVAALRTEASNLQIICRSLLQPNFLQNTGRVKKISDLARSCRTMQDAVRHLLELQLEDQAMPEALNGRSRMASGFPSSASLLASASQLFGSSTARSASLTDSFAAVPLSPQLPDPLLQSSRLLFPRDSIATLRSTDLGSQPSSSKSRRLQPSAGLSQRESAIPSESKRLRDRSIAEAMSDSIANLVLGSDAPSGSSGNEVIFSATSSGVLEGEELDLIEEVADLERRLEPTRNAGQGPSLLDLVHQCHNHDPWLDTSLTPFVLDGAQIGFLPSKVVKACVDDSSSQRLAGAPAVLRKVRFAMRHREILPPSTTSRTCEAITFTPDFATPEARTAGLNAVAQRWREARIFPDSLDGWRDELYAIYGPNPNPGSRNPIAFKLERAACNLFGFATFGVHLTAYTFAPGTGELKVWVPQRSSTKSTWPGYLDNSVAGGIVAGDLPMESMVRECEEEANLESALVERHIKQTGVLSYCYKTAKEGWIQPEVEYVYDLPLPADVTLQPKDGEVDHFELLGLDEIYDKMKQGRFKANCVLVLLDFLIRHGHITADKEPSYRQIVAQLHVDLRLPGP